MHVGEAGVSGMTMDMYGGRARMRGTSDVAWSLQRVGRKKRVGAGF